MSCTGTMFGCSKLAVIRASSMKLRISCFGRDCASGSIAIAMSRVVSRSLTWITTFIPPCPMLLRNLYFSRGLRLSVERRSSALSSRFSKRIGAVCSCVSVPENRPSMSIWTVSIPLRVSPGGSGICCVSPISPFSPQKAGCVGGIRRNHFFQNVNTASERRLANSASTSSSSFSPPRATNVAPKRI